MDDRARERDLDGDVKRLTADVASMESAKDHAFTPPPEAWIAERLRKLNDVLEQRTEKSALALRRLTGPVTLTPESPEVGTPYLRASCRFDALNLLHVADGGSNSLQWWTRLQPIRTAGEIEVEFALLTLEPFNFQRIAPDAVRMRRLGLSLRAIGSALEVDDKTVRKALEHARGNGALRNG